MPPRNLQRRRALTDAAIDILGTSGIHELSHRAVDAAAGVPAGTTSNYFRSRDELLEAVAGRVLELHLADMEAARDAVTGPPNRDQLAEMIGASLYDAATRGRRRFLAVYELTLEATRRPTLEEAMARLATASLEAMVRYHRALGLQTSELQIQMLLTLFGGAVLTLVTVPPEAVTPAYAGALARSIVTGALDEA
jgi:DNA-binding transcriptional regulator YbjK